MLDGASIRAVIVGGGEVAARKARGLLDAGASVLVVAPVTTSTLEALADEHAGALTLIHDAYRAEYLREATLVIAATDDVDVNVAVARDARECRLLVNVVDAPELGDFVTPAVHRAGEITIAVTAGGVPAAAARIRDVIATRVDARYAAAVDTVSELRRALLDDGARDRWLTLSSTMLGASFCDDVESGVFAARVDACR
jgi:precorrin-2 dehydrogenase/sirohydrochlorin ferrochelatase